MEIDIDPPPSRGNVCSSSLFKKNLLKKNILENPQEFDKDDSRA